MTQTCPYRNNGFSLLEVMIAVFVLSVGIIAIAGMQTTSANSASNSRLTIVDAVTVGRQMEQMLALPYDDIQLADADGAFLLQQPDHGPYALPDSHSTIEWEVDDEFPSAHAKRITVTVKRPGSGGQMHQVSYNYIKVKGVAP